ncbi:MAG: RsmG family class I SAM-dependent methyltransferase [Acidimicrobiia bacterium]
MGQGRVGVGEPGPSDVGLKVARRAVAWAGASLDGEQEAKLAIYAQWLADEAIPAGGLGPREAPRLWRRHIADSLTFAVGWHHQVPVELVDVGAGVGLPGIPLAILWPDCRITLLDRAGRRIRLLRRIVRILALDGVTVVLGDAFSLADEWEGIVFRGSVTAGEAVRLSATMLAEGGTAVLALSRRRSLSEESRSLVGMAVVHGLEAELQEIPHAILDGPAWLLIMRRNVV